MLVNVSNAPDIEFEIVGSHRKKNDNPVSYKRAIRGAWRQDSEDYELWKSYVRQQYGLKYHFKGCPLVLRTDTSHVSFELKPIYIGDLQPLTVSRMLRARMELAILWADDRHGDPDNIFKGIADALFDQDKYLDGSFVSEYAKDGVGRVLVKIFFKSYA